MISLIVLAALAGQISKFDDRAPEGRFETQIKLEEVERCLLAVGSPPLVYRQPDRPDDVMIVWNAASLASGNAAARVDLKRTGRGTTVTAWLSPKMVRPCI